MFIRTVTQIRVISTGWIGGIHLNRIIDSNIHLLGKKCAGHESSPKYEFKYASIELHFVRVSICGRRLATKLFFGH